MEWFEAIILGLVQGLTEFLPVSSSGHLAIARDLLGVEAPESLVFEVTVHLATVLSTIVVFWKPILKLLQGLFKFRYNDETDYVLKILISAIPIFFVGMFLEDKIEALFGSLTCVAVALVITALLLFLSDRLAAFFSRRGVSGSNDAASANCTPKHRNGISYWQALVIGLGQAFAAAPGLSRSGTTISTGLLCGVKREVVAQFSFLMVLVPILGKAFLDLIGGDFASEAAPAVLPLALGFVSAFASGLLACKAMIALVKRAKLSWFALYCFLLAAAIFIFK